MSLRLATFIAFVVVCLSCSGGSDKKSEQRGERRNATVIGEGACRTVMLEAAGTSSAEIVETGIDPAQPIVGYLPRAPEVVWWHAAGPVETHGHIHFVAQEGTGEFDFVADPDQSIRVVSATPGMPAAEKQLHVTAVSLTWTVEYNPPRPADPPPTIGIRVRVSPFPDGGLNRCLSYSCDPETGPQVCPPLAEGTPCGDSNVCNGAETCDGEGACRPGTNVAAGTSCSDGNPCNGVETCNGSGICAPGIAITAADVDDHDPCTADSCDSARGGIVNEPIAACVASTGAPPPDETTAPPFGDSMEFLYTGASPIQTGVTPTTIDKTRVGVVRGRVFDTDETTPATGAIVSIVGHAEYGQTSVRSDGWYDLAVNAGGSFVVDVQKTGRLRVQRQVVTHQKGFGFTEDIVLVAPYTSPDPFVVGAATGQVVRGVAMPVSDDADAPRQARLYFPPGTTPTNYTVSNGTPLAVEVTEFTRGANGPRQMPGDLPPTSGYTYALEVSLPAAAAGGVADVQFNQPISLYVDDFTNYPVGESVPLGYYDRARGAWLAEGSGKIIKVLTAPPGGQATIDTNGDGIADNALSVPSDELTMLAAQYAAGKQLWRMRLPHLSAWDANWGFGPPPDAKLPPPPDPDPDDGPDDPCKRVGSIIGCETRTLGERIPIVGTPYSLHYESDRAAGYRENVRIKIADGTSLPSSFVRAHIEIEAAGRRYNYVRQAPFNPDVLTWTWDGLDAYGRTIEQGMADVRIRVGYEYIGSPTFSTAMFGATPNSMTGLSGDRQSRTVTLWREARTRVRRALAKPLGFGGWTIDAHHALVVDDNSTIHFGDGRRRTVSPVNYQVDSVAGGGSSWTEGGPATQADLSWATDLVAAPDGALYLAQQGNFPTGGRIRRIGADGTITTIAGLPPVVTRTDGMPALNAKIWPRQIALGPDGAIYFTDYSSFNINQVWKIEPGPSPTLRLVAGTGEEAPTCFPETDRICLAGEGGPATAAKLRGPGSLIVDKEGAVLFVDNTFRIRRVGPEGTITTYFNRYPGSVVPQYLDLRADGVLFATYGTTGLLRIEPTGGWSLVHAQIENAWCEHGLGTSFFGLVRTLPDDSFLLSCYEKIILRTPTGSLLRVAGDATTNGYSGDGGPAIRAKFSGARPMTRAANGDIYVYDDGSSRIRRLRIAGSTSDGLHVRVPTEDGRQIFEFTPSGKHERTLSGLRGTPLVTFGYDATTHQLSSITDESGNVTQIARSASTIAITAPFGQVTTLALDANGYLASVTSPKTDEITQLAHSSSGLLTDLVDPNGHAHHFEYGSDGRLTKDVDATPGSLGQRLESTTTSTSRTVVITSAAGRQTRHTIEDDGSFGNPATNPDVRAVIERRRIVDSAGLETVMDKYLDGATATTRPSGTMTKVLETKVDPRWGMLASFASSVQSTVGSHTSTRTESRSASLATPGDPFSVSAQTITSTLSATGMTNAVTTRVFVAGPPATWTTTTPAGRQTRTTLDNLERATEIAVLGTAPITLHPTQLHYDARGRVDQVTRGSRVITTSFDAATGWVTSTTAPEGLGVTYASRDANGRPTSIVLPGSRTLAMGYDLTGSVVSVTPPSKPAHGFLQTPTNLLASYAPPDLGFTPKDTDYSYDHDGLPTLLAQPGNPIAFTYDSAGRRQSVADTVTKTFSYDAAGRLHTIATSDGVTLTNTFDGRLRTQEAISGPFSHAVNTAYDHFLRASGTDIDGANAVTFARDADGYVTGAAGMTVNRSTNHLLTSTVVGGVTDSFGYNAYGEIVSHAVTGSATSYSVAYTRDGIGRISEKTETIGGVTHSYVYAYDSAARLAAVYEDGAPAPARSWTYDANGNRSGGTYDDQDRLLTHGGYSFAHGPNGELSTKTDTSTLAETHYVYDAHGSLRHVDRPAPLAAIDYVIDGQNRRVGKKVGGALVQGFLYDGPRIVAELDGSGAVASRFVYVTGDHSPDLMITSSATYRFVKDHLGSPRLVVNASTGAVAQRLDYDEWGVVSNDTSAGFQPFGFAGGVWDRDTNLVRFGARDYDSITARWSSKDPLRFGAGPNFYVYVNDDPINYIDPTGQLDMGTAVAIGGAVLGGASGAAAAVLGGSLLGLMLPPSTNALPSGGTGTGQGSGGGTPPTPAPDDPGPGAIGPAPPGDDAPPGPSIGPLPGGGTAPGAGPMDSGGGVCTPYRTPDKPWSEDIKPCKGLKEVARVICCSSACDQRKQGDNGGQCFRDCINQ